MRDFLLLMQRAVVGARQGATSIAHSDWEANATIRHPYLKPAGTEHRPVNGYEATITTPTFSAEDLKKIVSSGNSIVVRENPSTTKRTSHGNSMVVRVVAKEVRTSSGNAITIKTIPKSVATSSGNSMVVKTIITKGSSTSSGNSLVVNTRPPKS